MSGHTGIRYHDSKEKKVMKNVDAVKGDVAHGVCQRETNSPKVKERFRRKPYGRIGEEFTS